MKDFLDKVNLEIMFDNLQEAIVILDIHKNIILVNDLAKSFFNTGDKNVLNDKIKDILPQIDRLDNTNKLLISHDIINNETVEICYKVLFDNNENTIGTMLKLKNRENKDNLDLNLSNDIFNIFESFYDGIWITDSKGYVLYTNYANEKVSGFTKSQVVGKHIDDLLKEKWFSNSVTTEVLKQKKRVTMMCYNYLTKKQVIVTGNPIFHKDGRLKYICNNIRDITELINKKRQLEKSQTFIDQQNNELQHLRALQFHNENYIVKSHNIKKAYDLACRASKFDSTVLIFGESGSGKEGIAETIVKYSERKDKPFIKINCGAIPENLIESELFGYEKGAFTGANQNGKIGKFEIAQHGTIFLDEIGELPLNLQVKLLRVIQDREVIRVGGNKSIPLDVRIIAATNKNLLDMVSKGTFREDLYYRLNVITIQVPPLRERKDDIPELLQYFLAKLNNKYSLKKKFSEEVISILINYNWPGNVRELQNFVESTLVTCEEDLIDEYNLHPKFMKEDLKRFNSIQINEIIPLKEAQDLLEKELIKKAMHKYKTTRRAAEFLEVDQSTIVRKMKRLEIKDSNYIIEN